MVDAAVERERVCCMCGDVGFPDKIFRCTNCLNRFQHQYCSNYYNESSSDPPELCDWCQVDQIRNSKQGTGGASKKPAAVTTGRSEYSGDKIKQQHVDREEGSPEKGKSPTGAPSPRTATRRYKLLKDVMC